MQQKHEHLNVCTYNAYLEKMTPRDEVKKQIEKIKKQILTQYADQVGRAGSVLRNLLLLFFFF